MSLIADFAGKDTNSFMTLAELNAFIQAYGTVYQKALDSTVIESHSLNAMSMLNSLDWIGDSLRRGVLVENAEFSITDNVITFTDPETLQYFLNYQTFMTDPFGRFCLDPEVNNFSSWLRYSSYVFRPYAFTSDSIEVDVQFTTIPDTTGTVVAFIYREAFIRGCTSGYQQGVSWPRYFGDDRDLKIPDVLKTAQGLLTLYSSAGNSLLLPEVRGTTEQDLSMISMGNGALELEFDKTKTVGNVETNKGYPIPDGVYQLIAPLLRNPPGTLEVSNTWVGETLIW